MRRGLGDVGFESRGENWGECEGGRCGSEGVPAIDLGFTSARVLRKNGEGVWPRRRWWWVTRLDFSAPGRWDLGEGSKYLIHAKP